ncbi:MAG TPA: nuclear transport factor 2 family protein [Acidimicrobiales bacterium]|nr:nuclear transport factor 2 family protein [Acidimicrobiales bacterium]
MSEIMSDAMADLVAKEAITEALHRYCVAVDRIDEVTWWHVWHRDATAHYEEIFDGSAASLMAWIFETHRSCMATSHQLSNVLIDVAGLTATSESYVTACIRAGGTDVVARGRYFDSWSNRDGAWRIDERRYQNDILQVIPVTTTET